MANSLRRNLRFNQNALARQQMPEQIFAVPVPTFKILGENKAISLARMPEGVSRLVENIMVRFGFYKTRDATLVIGDAAAYAVVHAMEVILSSGESYPVRFMTTGVDVYESGVWNGVGGDPWSTTNIAAFSATGWADTVVFADDSNGIFELDFTSGNTINKLLTTTGIIHLTTFNSRIIASFPETILWSVKNDSTDYTGLGSGEESLKSAPGGRSDLQTAVVPVSDQTAIVVRTQSFWQMTTSGDFDAPFAFSILEQGKGSQYPRTCVAIPGGVICLGEGAVWMKRLDAPAVDIGMPIVPDLLTTPSLLRLATAAYDAKNNEYRLSIPENTQTEGRVFRYNLDLGIWTEDVYPFPIRCVSFALFAQGLTIDELVGAIDDLQGAIDDLALGVLRAQIMFAMNNTRRFIVQENAPHNNDSTRDVNYDGTRVASGFRLETAPVRRGRTIDKTEVIQLQLEYRSEGPADISFEYSDDGGDTWTSIGTVSVDDSTKPQILSMDYSLDRDDVMFAVDCSATPTVELLDLFALTSVGGMKVDAS